MSARKVFGVAINDSEEAVSRTVNGKQVFCVFYTTWKDMLRRCYDKKYQKSKPTYIGCSVCDEWLLFSNFKKWMEAQDWRGKQLDKDLLKIGNKIYSPDFCVFISSEMNMFVSGSNEFKAGKLIGYTKDKKSNSFSARCTNPFTKLTESLGSYSDEISAHNAWKLRKSELAKMLANMESDQRIANALRSRYE